MSGLDSLLMSDLEVWTTLIILGAAAFILVPVAAAVPRSRRRRVGKLTILVVLLSVAAGGLAWHGLTALPSAASAMFDSGEG